MSRLPFTSVSSLLVLLLTSSALLRPSLAAGPQANSGQQEPSAYKDNAGHYSQQYSPQGNTAGHADYGLGTRQGALLGNPMLSILPIVLLVGLGALILIPIAFLLFNPLGFGGGLGGGGYGVGTGPYGKKRSVGEEHIRTNMLELVSQVSNAIEKYGGLFLEKASKPK